jgi:hypothetical protein
MQVVNPKKIILLNLGMKSSLLAKNQPYCNNHNNKKNLLFMFR